MSGYRIPDEFIKELLVRVDLVDLIDSRVPLKKTGANYVARCPFHTEKTPSFSVNRNKQFYYCFGCGASGNAISFLMAFNHLNFVEAIEDLATFVGLPMPQMATHQKPSEEADLSRLYGLMAQVADYFISQLRSTEEGRKAVAYLKKRGLSSEIAKEFMLGYASAEWRGLAKQFDPQALLAVGMLVSKEEGQVYDRFRDRLMFPIRDKRGRVIGFGGRVLDDGQPKYLNSPETPLFHKGREVYGLYELLQRNPKPGRILLVEGYMDVITLAQAGFGFAVAALGTAVSLTHINLLFRFASELVLCFDGDNAGREAAWRAMDAIFPCLKEGRQVRIMLLPAAHDPDSLVRHEGLQRFLERMETAQALSDYFFGQLLAGNVKLTEMEGRAHLINEAKPYLEKMPDGVFKDMMRAKLAKLTQTAKPVGFQKTASHKGKWRGGDSFGGRQKMSGARPPLQRLALALLVQNPTLVRLLEEKDFDWDGLEFKGADKFKEILQVIQQNKPATTAVLLECFRDRPDEPIVRQLAVMEFELREGLEAEFNGALDSLLVLAQSIRLERLLIKEKNEGLSQQEKEVLRKNLVKKFDAEL